MIFTAILYIFYYLIYGLLALLPDIGTLPSGIDSALDTVNTYLGYSNSMGLSTSVILSALTILFSFETALFLYKTINWIIKKTRGSG